MKKVIIFFLVNSLSIPLFCTQSSIIFSLVQYPNKDLISAADQEKKENKKSQQLMQPCFVHTDCSKTTTQMGEGISGIEVRYAGFSTVSNHYGMVQFPRKQIGNEINFLIIKKETPIFQIGPSLIAGWQAVDAQASAFYTVSLQQDHATQIYYFTTTKSSLAAYNKKQLAKDNAKTNTQQEKVDETVIPMNTIIIFADPESIVIPEGDSITTYTTNLLLPDVYVKQKPSNEDILQTLNSRTYFEPIKTKVVRSASSVAIQMENK